MLPPHCVSGQDVSGGSASTLAGAISELPFRQYCWACDENIFFTSSGTKSSPSALLLRTCLNWKSMVPGLPPAFTVATKYPYTSVCASFGELAGKRRRTAPAVPTIQPGRTTPLVAGLERQKSVL